MSASRCRAHDCSLAVDVTQHETKLWTVLNQVCSAAILLCAAAATRCMCCPTCGVWHACKCSSNWGRYCYSVGSQLGRLQPGCLPPLCRRRLACRAGAELLVRDLGGFPQFYTALMLCDLSRAAQGRSRSSAALPFPFPASHACQRPSTGFVDLLRARHGAGAGGALRTVAAGRRHRAAAADGAASRPDARSCTAARDAGALGPGH